jgi:hypothetical protein
MLANNVNLRIAWAERVNAGTAGWDTARSANEALHAAECRPATAQISV